MTNEQEKRQMLWKGEPIETLTREELIEALREMSEAYTRSLQNSKDMLDRLI